jgi:hypothetical protein
LPCILVDRVASVEHVAILSGMALRRGNVADATVPMFMVV